MRYSKIARIVIYLRLPLVLLKYMPLRTVIVFSLKEL